MLRWEHLNHLEKTRRVPYRQRGEVLLQEVPLSQNIYDPLAVGIPSAQREDNSWISKKGNKIKTDVVFPALTSAEKKHKWCGKCHSLYFYIPKVIVQTVASSVWRCWLLHSLQDCHVNKHPFQAEKPPVSREFPSANEQCLMSLHTTDVKLAAINMSNLLHQKSEILLWGQSP